MNNLNWYWIYVPYLDVSDAHEDSALKAGYDKVVFKSEADRVIAELKESAKMHDFFWEGCGFAKRGFKNSIAVSETFDNLEAENRRLKRALWLARAEWAKETQFLWNVYCHCDKLYFCKPFCVSTRKNPFRYISRMNVVEWDEFWGKIKNKCLSKAEEYK